MATARRCRWALAAGLGLLGVAVVAAPLPPSHYEWPGSGTFDPAEPVVNGTSCDDVRQTQAPTCAFLSSLAAAGAGRNLTDRIRYNGGKSYTVTLSHDKQWRHVDVTFDGWDKRDPEPNDPGEFWPALYQRAYLKLWNVDTSAPGKWAVAGTDPTDGRDWQTLREALHAVTGWPVEHHDPRKEAARDSCLRVRAALGARKPVVAAFGGGGKGEKRLASGTCLYLHHAYTGVRADGDAVELRNPWGHDVGHEHLEHTGKSRNGRPLYTFKSGIRDGMRDDPNDGVVRVSWDEFRAHSDGYVVGETGEAGEAGGPRAKTPTRDRLLGAGNAARRAGSRDQLPAGRFR